MLLSAREKVAATLKLITQLDQLLAELGLDQLSLHDNFVLVLGLQGSFLLFKRLNHVLKLLELGEIPLLPVVEELLDLLVLLVELFREPLLCFEIAGDLNLELVALAADNLNLTVLVSRLEGDLFKLLVQHFNVLLVDLDL